tara:strand:- start:2577 stop:3560 length:984 start_codon:yes stop_codon:yes gene_type:complete
MTYFLGRDVDVYITLEDGEHADKCVGLVAAPDSGNFPTVGLIATGSTAPSGNIFANGMDSDANVLASRVHDLTGVDLSISSSDEDVGPFLGQVSTQSVELRKEHIVTLTHKKGDEVWDAVYNGPSQITDYEGSIALSSMDGGTGQANLTGALVEIQKCKVGDYVGGIDGIPYGATIASLTEAGANSVVELSTNLTDTLSGVAPIINSLPTFQRQGARYGIMFDKDDSYTEKVSMGRTNPKHVVSGALVTRMFPSEKVYYGYRVHVRLKDQVEVYTVRNCAITGHTVSLNADGTSEETLELKTTVMPIMYTGSSTNTFYKANSTAGEL